MAMSGKPHQTASNARTALPYVRAYHGGTEAVIAPEIRPRLRAPDFGPGFYTTASAEQAARWALRMRRTRGAEEAVVSVYDISELSESGLDIVLFEEVTEEWFDSVLACRNGMDVFACRDVVVGPVANDNVYQTIRFFETGVYSKDEAMRRLLAERLFNQIAFKTDSALRLCRYISHHAAEEMEGGQ